MHREKNFPSRLDSKMLTIIAITASIDTARLEGSNIVAIAYPVTYLDGDPNSGADDSTMSLIADITIAMADAGFMPNERGGVVSREDMLSGEYMEFVRA
jgi:hypothetical protein